MAIAYLDSVDTIEPDQLAGFFVGWPKPPSTERHLAILRGSRHVWLAMHHDTCVGFINAISDGLHSAFIPLLEVLPSHQGQGIGTNLVNRMTTTLAGYYSIDVVCDPVVMPFYARAGFASLQAMAKRTYRHQDASGRQPADA